MYYDTQSAPRPDNGGKTKVWKIIALVLLLLCALPVLIPVALCVAGGVLVVALCVAGAALTAVLCVAGGVICAGLCVLGGLLCLALLQLAALIGIGFGVVLLFQTPASGLAILGVSLLITGAGALCWIALWQLVVPPPFCFPLPFSPKRFPAPFLRRIPALARSPQLRDKMSRSPAPCGASPAGVFLFGRSFCFQGAVHR